MSNVFLTGLSNDHRARLASANVPCYDLTLGDEFGIMIEQQHLESALTALNAFVESQQPSDFEGIAKAVLKAKALGQPPKIHKVTNDWKGKDTDNLHEAVRQLLIPFVDKPVVMHHSQGYPNDPAKDQQFHIYLHSSPVRYAEPGAVPPAVIWGIPNGSRGKSFHASGRGQAILDDATGYPVAEYVAPNALYVHMNFFDKYDDNRIRIFRVLLQRVVRLVDMPPEERRAIMRRRFIEECSKSAVRVVRDTADSGVDNELPAGLRKHSSSLHSNSRFDGANGLQPGDVDGIDLVVPQSHLAMCNIPAPVTGLEGKFSLRFTAALALVDGETGDAAFTDDRVSQPRLTTMRDRVTVTPQAGDWARGTEVTLRTTDGRRFSQQVNLNIPASDLALQRERLEAKFRALAGPAVGGSAAEQLVVGIRQFEAAPSVDAILAATVAAPAGIA